mgnify:CR=1 FL=1
MEDVHKEGAFARAWRDTLNPFGGVLSISLSVLFIPLAGLLLAYFTQGLSAVREDFVKWLVYGAAAFGAVFLVFGPEFVLGSIPATK